jgi:predicted methyltransferase
VNRSSLISTLIVALSLGALPVACGEATPEPTVAPPPPSAPPPPPPMTASAPVEPPPPPEPTPEEKKKIADAKQLVEDRAKMEAAAKTELARWTPDLHGEAKALVSKKYPSLKAAVEAVLASKIRVPGNADRDKSRHPREELEFFGLKPTMTVLESGPGEGWYTEILAPTLAQKGKLLVTSTDPNASVELRPTMYAQRLRAFLDKSPELFGKVQSVVYDPKTPALGLDGTVDAVLVIRGMHGMVQNNLHKVWLGEFYKALKPRGVLGIEQHRAKADAVAEESAKKGYLPEEWLIKEVEAAGFKLVKKSDINANPKDTKDYEEGVWALPPTLRMGDKDRDKYVAIGESDRMTLKFEKVAPPRDKAGKDAGKAPAKDAKPKK